MTNSLPRYTLNDLVYESDDVMIVRGRRDADGVPVVVKLWKSEYPSMAQLARIKHEHAVLKSVAHPGVVAAYALERHRNGLALVMEDFGGAPLSEMIAAGPLQLATALRIASAVADALAAIHERGFLHKDVKPHNILVNRATWQIKLADFGIAAPLPREAQRPTQPAEIEGTLAYIAPEQTGRMNRLVDNRADLYALGVTLYEMLTGVLPFPTTEVIELVHCHIARAPTPPRELCPEIPAPVSDIVMKLLAKAAEDRYQRAAGLKADLDACLAALEATGRIDAIELGREDAPRELRIPQRLYGREGDLASLLAAWQRATEGEAALVLLSGDAGVGKSALVNEMQARIAGQRGHLISGKFDQIQRSRPYASVAGAFADLVRQLLAENPEALALWKSKLLAAVGANGRVIVELIPEVELLLGPQPPVAELPPTEAQNRLSLVFQRFLCVFASADHPLALFLDDLQWADRAALKLIEHLLTAPEASHLLVLGAYRDSEAASAHAVEKLAADLRKARARVDTIALAPLARRDVEHLVADALAATPDRVEPLAALIWERTHGNPFFINQLLLALHQAGLIAFDPKIRAFAWDEGRIRAFGVTDDVADLMVRKLNGLDAATRRALMLAACVGHEFRLKTLATIAGQAPDEAAGALWNAIREGLVVPLDAEYRFLRDARGDDVPTGGAPPASFDVRCRFVHDRVQQAAYSLIEDADRKPTHLRIGRLLLATTAGAAGDDARFEIANHLNLAVELIDDPAERLALARLDLVAGRKARAGAAYDTAAGYLRAGMEALGEHGWEAHGDLAREIALERAQCAYLSGAFDEAESVFDLALERARSIAERLEVQALRSTLYTTLGKFQDVLRIAAQELARVGAPLPDGAAAIEAATAAAIAEVEQNLANRPIHALLDRPALDDPETSALLRISVAMSVAVYILRPELYPLVIARQVTLAIRHGTTLTSPTSYMTYASILAGVLGRYAEADEFGRLALDLGDRLNVSKCKLHCLFATHVCFFRHHHRTGLELLWRGYDAGFETGDFVYLSYICHAIGVHVLVLGEELPFVDEETTRLLLVMRRTNDALSTMSLRLTRQAARNLMGKTKAWGSLHDDGFDEDGFAATLDENALSYIAFHYYALKTQALYFKGDHAGARAMAAKADKSIGGRANLQLAIELTFYTALALSALHPTGAAPERFVEETALFEGRLARWAESCPQNFRHKHLLVLAERARVLGDDERATDLFEKAIDDARASELLHEEALASELAARYHLGKGRTRIARAYMTDAHHGYARWGATAKAKELAAAYPHLLPAAHDELAVRRSGAPMTLLTTSTITLRGAPLDAAAVVRAAQTIAGEIELDKVIDRLLRIIVGNAGAQRGVLLLHRDGALTVEATMTVDPDDVRVGLGVAAAAYHDLPMSIVQYVERTREPVVLGDAPRERRFASDRYVAAAAPRSILCLAMMHHGRLAGVVYLENRTTADVFTPGRLEIAALLASQAATSVENALLYERIQQANERLEDEVARRTEELRAANVRLAIELEERARSEEERAALQGEIIRAQEERLKELSTPLIPITRHIMVMPLIGTVDSRRAGQVLDAALRGVEGSQASVVLIDITGVTTVDTEVASTLIRTKTALELLGAHVVLTGVRPRIAQTLVALDVNLEAIVTKGTLESGIAYALRRTEGALGARSAARATTAPRAR